MIRGELRDQGTTTGEGGMPVEVGVETVIIAEEGVPTVTPGNVGKAQNMAHTGVPLHLQRPKRLGGNKKTYIQAGKEDLAGIQAHMRA